MDYLCQKIKSIESICPPSKIHRQIMRRAALLRFRQLKEPFLILASLSAVGFIIDIWHLMGHNTPRVIQAVFTGFSFTPSAIVRVGLDLSGRGLTNHPDLMVGLAVDIFVIGYLLYLFVRFDRVSSRGEQDNRILSFAWWNKNVFWMIKAAKNQIFELLS